MEDTIAEMSDLDKLLESVEGLNLSSSSHRDTYLLRLTHLAILSDSLGNLVISVEFVL